MKRVGQLSEADACCFDAELNETDIVWSLDRPDQSEHVAVVEVSNGHIGLRTRGGARVVADRLTINCVKNDGWQLWNGGSSVGELYVNHSAAIHYCDANHPDVLQAFAKSIKTFEPEAVFEKLHIGYARCVIDCADPARSKINGFLFTETCLYREISLFTKGLDYISNSPAPYFLDMTNGTQVTVGSDEHPVDADRVSGKGIRIGARGDKRTAPACEDITIHAYRGVNIVLEGSAKDATKIVWHEKTDKANDSERVEVPVMADEKIMKMSKAGVRQLIESEKPMPTLYYCEAGVPTIGVGHELTRSQLNSCKIPLTNGSVIDFRDDRPLSHDDIMDLLSDDLISREQVVFDSVRVPLDQHNFDALVHFVFNIGRTAFKNSTLLRELNGFNYSEVPSQFKRWKYITQDGVKKVSNGLINRRLTEVRMWHGADVRSDDMREWADKMAAPAVPVPVSVRDVDLVDAAKSLGIEPIDDGFNQTLEMARQQARSEIDEQAEEIRAKAIDAYRTNNVQKPMESRTNRSVAGMIVSTGLRVLVGTTGLSAVFAEPAVAEIATTLVVGGLDLATAVLGVAAIKFRNVATKFVG